MPQESGGSPRRRFGAVSKSATAFWRQTCAYTLPLIFCFGAAAPLVGGGGAARGFEFFDELARAAPGESFFESACTRLSPPPSWVVGTVRTH